MPKFSVAGGSVVGFDHTRPGQPGSTNNQDAYTWRIGESSTVVIICDGCGSNPYSEVGAHMCAQAAVSTLSRLIRRRDKLSQDNLPGILQTLQGHMLANITSWAHEMAGAKTFDDVVQEYFFCTVIGAVITADVTAVFSQGDGVYAVNEKTTVIPPYSNNAPPYLGYGLLPGMFRAESQLQFSVRAIVPTVEVQSALIGSDGVYDFMQAETKKLPGKPELLGPLSQFWTMPRYWSNPDAIRRRLALANLETIELDPAAAAGGSVRGRIKPGLLHDDTTVVLIRREPEQKE